MKISLRLSYPLAMSLLMGALWISPSARAQDENPAPLQTRQAYELPVKNWPAHLLAWWIDPAHQPRPAELGALLPEEIAAAGNMDHQERPNFFLPPGIETVIPLDGQNMLLVFGEEQAVQHLRQILPMLDNPTRQIEIETRVVSMSPEDMKAVGFNTLPPPWAQPGASPAQSSVTFPFSAIIPGNLPTLLSPHEHAINMSAPTIPRVVARNGLHVSLVVSRSHPAPVSLRNSLTPPTPPIETMGLPEVAPLEIQTPLEITLTSFVKEDGTLNLRARIIGRTQIGRKNTADALTLGTPSVIEVMGDLKDGETFGIRGLNGNFTSAFSAPTTPKEIPRMGDIPIISELFQEKKTNLNELVVFFTIHIMPTAKP